MGKILVTGGTVFVSRYVAEYFAKRGDQIFVLNRGSRPQSHGVTLIQGDRGNLGTVLKKYNFDAVLDVTRQTALMPETKPLLQGLQESYAWFRDHREVVVRKPYEEYLSRL